ncbi:protein MIZU-KUSSEI 1-like [Zingiber officinale]|uniref:Protein MIZU-KUSSEI 1 n=1 Tax=Zingiber officinale TaxID=94328 RepID=A0A8J5KPP7_ZINOF|nr:protein MIZU-KUSSEI 1-like [Zingiber officinale]KAG6495368.1 hypothetical protein ZIOFF_043171 [Zingiber officinale]
MRTMIDLGSHRGTGLYIIDTATDVDCTKDVRLGRRFFRSLIERVVPCCAVLPISNTSSDDSESDNNSTTNNIITSAPAAAAATTTVTGTFFGHRRGRLRFCVHDHPAAASSPLLLMEFTVPTAYLAREMQHGLLRVALESGGGGRRGPLLGAPVWTMYCNGRKVGFAIRRRATESDAEVFRMMRSVSAGTGVLPSPAAAATGEAGELLYLRASFERVIGSTDSESFHMIDPAGESGAQQLSIFLFRTRFQ